MLKENELNVFKDLDRILATILNTHISEYISVFT